MNIGKFELEAGCLRCPKCHGQSFALVQEPDRLVIQCTCPEHTRLKVRPVRDYRKKSI